MTAWHVKGMSHHHGSVHHVCVCVHAQALEALRDELEDLEEALVDSVKDAVADRNKVRVSALPSYTIGSWCPRFWG